MSTKRYGAKKRVVTAEKTMRFETSYGTRSTVEKQLHAEEREAKRWLMTRLDTALAHVRRHDVAEATRISDIQRTIKGRDMMAMKVGTTDGWDFTYSGIHVFCTVRRLA